MQQSSLLRQVVGCFIEQHTCAAPDARGDWVAVSRARCTSMIGIYVCPECGQHMARASNFSVFGGARVSTLGARSAGFAQAL